MEQRNESPWGRTLVAGFGCAVALWVSACGTRLVSSAEASIMSYDELSRTDRAFPHVLHFDTGDGQLCLVGVGHSFDAHGATTGLIWSEWTAFQPSVAYFEGLDWAMGSNQAVISEYGEPAYLRFMAFVSRVPVTSIEPDLVDEIGHLQRSWSDTEIRAFYTLRGMAEQSLASGRERTDEEITQFLQTWFPTLDSFSPEPATSESLGRGLSGKLPAGFNWRRPDISWVDPTAQLSFLNQIARDSGRFRDQHMLQVLLEETLSGKRTFLAVGYNHAYMLEPALTEVLGPPRQPRGAGPTCAGD